MKQTTKTKVKAKATGTKASTKKATSSKGATSKPYFDWRLAALASMFVVFALAAGIGYYVQRKLDKPLTGAVQVGSQLARPVSLNELKECAREKGASLDASQKTVVCSDGGEILDAHEALEPVELSAAPVKDLSWSELPPSVQQGLQGLWSATCEPSDTQPALSFAGSGSVTVSNDNQTVLIGNICDNAGSAYIYKQMPEGWKEVARTQLAFGCATLQKFDIPAALVRVGDSATCYDDDDIERVVVAK